MTLKTEDPSPKKTPPKKKVMLLLVLLIGAGVAAKFVIFKEVFRYAGTLEATKVDLSARLPSTIATVKVQEGEQVTENQELVVLACDDLKVASDLANENFQRNLRLYKAGSASQEIFDQTKNRKQDVDVRVSWCTVRSPIKGAVLSRYHEPGEWVNPGTKLLTLANIKEIWTYIYVPQTMIAKLKPGMKLKAFLPELNEREFQGTIIKISEEAEFTPKNVQTRAERSRLVFGVKVSFAESNEQEVLKPGMTVEVKLPQE